MNKAYKAYLSDIRRFIPADRIYTDELRRFAWGTDASFYRRIPQIVVRSTSEQEVVGLLQAASKLDLPVTFRAAGTSLSGQSVSDSILIVAGKHWEQYSLACDASTITMQPGIIGNRVNDILAPYGRMFAPDPASKGSAMVGGIVINNASGMNCGTHANSDKILQSVRIVLADGTTLDTGNEASRESFRHSHPEFIRDIEALRDEVRSDSALSERIRYKYSIKNVTGLNILPLAVFDDPFDIIAHSIVGSEGTLAFLSEVTVKTSHLPQYSASAMLYFDDLHTACQAVVAMRHGPVYSAELLDSKSLSSVNDTTGTGLTAVLTETKGDTPEELQANIDAILSLLSPFKLYVPARFTSDPAEYSEYWKIRAGIFPSVGGTRPIGTTVLIEDVAFHIDDLPNATVELQQLLVEHGYDDACIYGHALEGNYHFIISQAFDNEADVERYRQLMEGVEHLVVDRYDGSLKAEHGTGRNMAPFVAKEWGDKAWSIMKRLKNIFDPHGILNPGVIFNDDPLCYIRGIKSMPRTNDHVDRCIECGFCEVNCVTCGHTLSARQRIAAQREISRLARTGEDTRRLAALRKQFQRLGTDTCAGDGLCSTSCPMGINTADMIHDLRSSNIPPNSLAYKIGTVAARHLNVCKAMLRPLLSAADSTHRLLGDNAVNRIGAAIHTVGIPLWTSALPSAYYPHSIDGGSSVRKVVYFPSCINQTMGATGEKTSGNRPRPLIDTMVALCRKAGYEVIFPLGMGNLCCGMIWESKGMPDIANQKVRELEQALLTASENGRWPVLCDQSPCLHRMRNHIASLHLYEPGEFIHDFLAPHLSFHPIDTPVALHLTCSTRHMHVEAKLIDLAKMCATKVIVPDEVGCCGFAGDKGFTHPDINKYALRKLSPTLHSHGVAAGYSNSRTCEIGLTSNTGIPYKSITYLVDDCTTPLTDIK